MSMDEWQLLLESEDISIGDKLEVELEDGSTEEMKLVRYSQKYVTLRDSDKNLWRFLADSLESRCGTMLILGKVD